MTAEIHKTLIVLGVTMLLSACASPGDYSTPVNAFADATMIGDQSLKDYDAVIDAAALENNLAFATKNRAWVRPQLGDTCSAPTDEKETARCRLALRCVDRPNGPKHCPPGVQESPLEPPPADANARLVMKGLVTYAGNLKAITSKDNGPDISDATSKTVSEIKSFADTVDKAADGHGAISGKVDAYAGPVGDAFSFVASAYVERKKLDALRTVTAKMNSIMPDIVKLIDQSAIAGITIERNKAQSDFNDADLAFLAAPTRENLDRLRNAAAAFDGTLSQKTEAQFGALGEAHDALTTALATPKPDFSNLWPALRRVMDEAQKLAAIAKKFKAAAAGK